MKNTMKVSYWRAWCKVIEEPLTIGHYVSRIGATRAQARSFLKQAVKSYHMKWDFTERHIT